MASKMYRSALGKPIDMGSLLTKNEKVRAVGNMGVNARGDKVSHNNKEITSRAQQVNQEYRKQIRNQIQDVPVTTPSVGITDDEIEGFDTPLGKNSQEIVQEQEAEVVETQTKEKKGGLASAIAKAREVEQKKLQTPREESRSKAGVKKI